MLPAMLSDASPAQTRAQTAVLRAGFIVMDLVSPAQTDSTLAILLDALAV